MKSLSIPRRAAEMLLLSALGLAALSSCQKGPTPLASPAPTVKATVHSLTFSWTAVDGAVEYAYQLDDAAGTKVADGKTEELSVSFDHLIEGAEYCFTITAYCAEGDSSHEISRLPQSLHPPRRGRRTGLLKATSLTAPANIGGQPLPLWPMAATASGTGTISRDMISTSPSIPRTMTSLQSPMPQA